MKEAYEKRLNVQIHDISETSDSAYKSPLQTLDAIHKFMKDGLLISDPTTVPLTDYHRLLQKPLFKNGVKVTRPIIIKLICAPNKKKKECSEIWKI